MPIDRMLNRLSRDIRKYGDIFSLSIRSKKQKPQEKKRYIWEKHGKCLRTMTAISSKKKIVSQ